MNPAGQKLIECDDFETALAAVCGAHLNDQPLADHFHPVDAAALAEPYRTLLVHRDHMTSALGTHYGQPVALRVLDERQCGDTYSREILLTLADSDVVVEYGIMTIDLSLVSSVVRSRILARATPLGDILTDHDVLRKIEPKWFVRVDSNSPILTHFGPGVHEAFGRIGMIHCNHQPAVELLEVVVDRRDRP